MLLSSNCRAIRQLTEIAARKSKGASVTADNYFRSSNQSHFLFGQLFPSDFLLVKTRHSPIDKNAPGSIWFVQIITLAGA
ncbi:MAG TPA: hypothetical protein VFC36_08010, partial [Paludibacter sp.]|nr:hypothetical protein [Paludibacter sp.]